MRTLYVIMEYLKERSYYFHNEVDVVCYVIIFIKMLSFSFCFHQQDVAV